MEHAPVAALTLPQLVQLYAPLVGLLALAFWSGALSSRVLTLEREVAKLKEDGAAAGTIRDRLTRIETLMEGVEANMHTFSTGMSSVQRQLGNLMGKNIAGVYTMDNQS